MNEQPDGGRRRWWHWWPVAIAPAMVLSVYTASGAEWHWYLAKSMHEVLALCLMSAAVVAFGVRAWRGRNPAHVILTVLAIAFLLREIHWRWTTKGIYAALAVLAVWAWVWRKRLWRGVRAGQFWPWLCATGAAYVLGDLVARRVFRGVLPNEQELHTAIEEVLENAAHAMLLVTAFADTFRSGPAPPPVDA